MNQACERLLGYTQRDLAGLRRDQTVLPPASLVAETEAHARLVSGEVDFYDRHSLRRRAVGTLIDVAVYRGAVREVDASLACIVAVARTVRAAGWVPEPAMSAVQSA